MNAAMRAFFDGPGGQRSCFCLHHVPAGPVRAALVHVPAFAEEMNKSRRMVALTARALAARGCAVLLIDLSGTGDAKGDFADARWQTWLNELRWALKWLRAQYDVPLWLWGHRMGAVLAANAAAQAGLACDHLLWQPVTQGRLVIRNFLRLKAAATWAGQDAKTVVESARAELATGRPVEIAGYPLHPALADALETAELAPPPATPGRRLVWLEVAGSSGEPAIVPASRAPMQRWAEAGYVVDARAVAGPPFWQTVEIEEAPALVEATVDAVVGSHI